jgi:hypothetical protein
MSIRLELLKILQHMAEIDLVAAASDALLYFRFAAGR